MLLSMKISSDWHIHSRNSCDEAALSVVDLVAEASAKGVTDFGITDHIHTPFNLPDLRASRKEFDSVQPSNHFHFGVEASCVSQWEIDEVAKGVFQEPVYGVRSGGKPGCQLAIALTPEDVDALGVEYVIGGTHWPMYVPYEREAVIRDFHRQNMFLATHPLVDIIAHPWWWHGHWQEPDGMYRTDPWFADFGQIPRSMHDEFAASARENGKKIEINIGAMLLSECYTESFRIRYCEYLAELKSSGVTLSMGSDCHDLHYEPNLETTASMLKAVGITESDLWRLPPRA